MSRAVGKSSRGAFRSFWKTRSTYRKIESRSNKRSYSCQMISHDTPTTKQRARSCPRGGARSLSVSVVNLMNIVGSRLSFLAKYGGWRVFNGVFKWVKLALTTLYMNFKATRRLTLPPSQPRSSCISSNPRPSNDCFC